jgi:uncharacterized damage-inducible protein DinB
MKLNLMGAAAWAVMSAGPAAAGPLTSLEKQRLAAHFEMTTSWLQDEVADLSAAQAQFRPAEGAWSILEVVEHLVTTEPIYWKDFQKAMKAPPSGVKGPATDEGMLWYGIDRTNRQKAIAGEGAAGQLRSLGEGLKKFRRLRERMLEYVKTTRADLRSHYVEREGCDAYQWLLLISAHAQRHILQIREIRADPRFPRK